MFVIYCFWGLFFSLFSVIHVLIENFFYTKNNPFLMRKRIFKYISYFEKLILVLFYKRGWFDNSIAHLYRKKDIIEYRRNFYPIIYSFHIKLNKINYTIDDLSFFSKQFKLYFCNNVFKNKIIYLSKNHFKKSKNYFITYLILQNLFFNKYYNLNSYFFFEKKSNLNLIKLNRIFMIFFLNSSKKFISYNLNKWYDWYTFIFKTSSIFYLKKNIKISKLQKKNIKIFKNIKIAKWINIVFKYKKNLVLFENYRNFLFKGIIHFKFNKNFFFNIRINSFFKTALKSYLIKFSDSSVNIFIQNSFLKHCNIQYLRKNRIFNKGRYSRNRQLYRTGVYWCLWLNIIMVYGLYFLFYRFSFNFGYFWWGILIIAYSTIFSRIVKYNFFSIFSLKKEFYNTIIWYSLLFLNLKDLVKFFTLKYFKHINVLNYFLEKNKSNFLFFYKSFYKNFYFFIKFYKKYNNNKNNLKTMFIWQNIKKKDASLLKYKTIIHFLREFFRLIIW